MANPTPRKDTPFDLRSFARSYAPMSVRTLASLATNEETPASARVAACIHLLDRGYGKAEQSHDLNADIQITIRQILDTSPQPLSDNQKPMLDVTPNNKPKRSRT